MRRLMRVLNQRAAEGGWQGVPLPGCCVWLNPGSLRRAEARIPNKSQRLSALVRSRRQVSSDTDLASVNQCQVSVYGSWKKPNGCRFPAELVQCVQTPDRDRFNPLKERLDSHLMLRLQVVATITDNWMDSNTAISARSCHGWRLQSPQRAL